MSSSKERLAVALASLGMFLSTLDTGVINVALPSIATNLHTTISATGGAVTSYAIALSLSILFFGWLADRIGRARVYLGGMLVFAIGSAGCAFAASIGSLDAFRAVTGLGAAMLQATSAAIITERVPLERRAGAFGTMSAFLSLGPVLGPSLGGIVVSVLAWPWIFWLALPVCAAGTICALALPRANSTGPKDDVARPAREPARAVNALQSAAPFVACAALGASFIAAFLASPFLLERGAKLTPWETGLVLLCCPAGAMIAAKISGELMRKRHKAALIATGLIGMCVVDAALANVDPRGELALFAIALGLYGAASGIMQTPAIASVMETAGTRRQSTVGATQRFVQNLGIGGGSLIAAMLLEHRGGAAVWYFAAVVCAVAVAYYAVAFVMPVRSSAARQRAR